MKKFIFLVMLLLSGFANATRVYDHVSGFFSTDPNQEQFDLGFLTTYTITENNVTKHYAGVVYDQSQHMKEYELGSAGVVNKVKSYNFTNERGFVEHVGFIAMNGGLYVVRNLGFYPETPKLITEVSGARYNVINVLKTDFGFTIVVNKNGFFGGTSTVLYNMKLIGDNEYKLKSSGEISKTATSTEYNNYVNHLIIATLEHKVYILALDKKDDYKSPWHKVAKISGMDTDRFMVLPNVIPSSIIVVKYSTTLNSWYINSDISNSPDFTDFPYGNVNGEANPGFFDYAAKNFLDGSIQTVITSGSKITSVELIDFNSYQNHRTFRLSDLNLTLISVGEIYCSFNYAVPHTNLIYLIKRDGNQRYQALVFLSTLKDHVEKHSYYYEFPL